MNRPALALLALLSSPALASVPVLLAQVSEEVDPSEAAGQAVGKVVGVAVIAYLVVRALRKRG
jgi:hypothetical protein